MSDEHDPSFLTRWSRRKRGVAVVPAESEPPSPVVAVEEEIANPPPAETIPLEEIGGWLKKRLPDGWREAALRRVWTVDAAIRDYIGPADYQWDFTVPDGVPGWGPLTDVDQVAKLLDRVINGTTDLPPPPLPDPEPVADGRVPIPQELHQKAEQEGPIPTELAPYEAGVRRKGGRATPIFPSDSSERSV